MIRCFRSICQLNVASRGPPISRATWSLRTSVRSCCARWGRGLGLAETLAGCTRDRLEHSLVVDRLVGEAAFPQVRDHLWRCLSLGRGSRTRRRYPKTPDALRTDPLLKPTVGHAPESDRALRSQPTMSWLENTAGAS